MSSHYINFTEQNNTGIIKLNRPDALNALNYEMAVDFLEILSKWKTTHSIKRVLLLGKGKAFCAGGDVKNPTYKQVCSGKTGHAEVARIEYDPTVITYEEILNVFWQSHDPTTLNRQGNDVGSQYRSVIYYHNDQQKVLADESKTIANQSDFWSDPIVTEIAPLMNYFEAEDYHHDYYNNNPNQPYCIFVIKPKLDKLEKDRVID